LRKKTTNAMSKAKKKKTPYKALTPFGVAMTLARDVASHWKDMVALGARDWRKWFHASWEARDDCKVYLRYNTLVSMLREPMVREDTSELLDPKKVIQLANVEFPKGSGIFSLFVEELAAVLYPLGLRGMFVESVANPRAGIALAKRGFLPTNNAENSYELDCLYRHLLRYCPVCGGLPQPNNMGVMQCVDCTYQNFPGSEEDEDINLITAVRFWNRRHLDVDFALLSEQYTKLMRQES
jgi:hypothetical protein